MRPLRVNAPNRLKAELQTGSELPRGWCRDSIRRDTAQASPFLPLDFFAGETHSHAAKHPSGHQNGLMPFWSRVTWVTTKQTTQKIV